MKDFFNRIYFKWWKEHIQRTADKHNPIIAYYIVIWLSFSADESFKTGGIKQVRKDFTQFLDDILDIFDNLAQRTQEIIDRNTATE